MILIKKQNIYGPKYTYVGQYPKGPQGSFTTLANWTRDFWSKDVLLILGCRKTT